MAGCGEQTLPRRAWQRLLQLALSLYASVFLEIVLDKLNIVL